MNIYYVDQMRMETPHCLYSRLVVHQCQIKRKKAFLFILELGKTALSRGIQWVMLHSPHARSFFVTWLNFSTLTKSKRSPYSHSIQSKKSKVHLHLHSLNYRCPQVVPVCTTGVQPRVAFFHSFNYRCPPVVPVCTTGVQPRVALLNVSRHTGTSGVPSVLPVCTGFTL